MFTMTLTTHPYGSKTVLNWLLNKLIHCVLTRTGEIKNYFSWRNWWPASVFIHHVQYSEHTHTASSLCGMTAFTSVLSKCGRPLMSRIPGMTSIFGVVCSSGLLNPAKSLKYYDNFSRRYPLINNSWHGLSNWM